MTFPPPLPQSELTSHEPHITAASSEAQAMVTAGHYGQEEITTRLGRLSSMWAELKVIIHVCACEHYVIEFVGVVWVQCGGTELRWSCDTR